MLKIKPPNYQFCPFCGKKLGIRIEEGKERKYCASCKWAYYPCLSPSVLAVIKKIKKVLLVKRNRDPYKGTWMFPAGFIEFGELPEVALKREVEEETGLKVKKADLFGADQVRDDPRSMGHISFYYQVETKKGQIKTDNEENQDIGWFDIQKPPKIGWKNHQKIMKFLQKGGEK